DADSQLLFLANDIPAIGYRLFWLTPSQEIPSQNQSETIALEFSNQKTAPQNQSETLALEFSNQQTSSQNQSETLALEFSNQQTAPQNQSETIALEFNNQQTAPQNQSETIALEFNNQQTAPQNQSETLALEFSNQQTAPQNQSETIALEFNNQQTTPKNQSETLALEFSNQQTSSQNQSETLALEFILDNEFLRVVVNEETGDLNSVFDKLNNREILSASGNQLQAFKDEGQYWDAWNIDPNYAEKCLPPFQLKSIEWLDQGLLQQKLRVVRQLGESEFIQDYILQINSQILKIHTKVNWLERHVLVKAAFPLNLEANFATYEIPCGAIQRTTKPTTPAEKAKWEVPALHWADLTEEGDAKTIDSYGVSLLNDCKYGYDAQPNQLRLSLLRSPEWPNPEADKGNHEFSYGLYPHIGSWEKAETVKRGYEFNQPIIVVLGQHQTQNQTLNDKASFIDISGQNSGRNSGQNLILTAFKQAEDNPQQWILRCYECNGETAQLQLTSDIGLKVKESVDLLERPLQNSELSSEST
ncbi:MAG: glycoside hydrolase family 38 C-terminal domain-containing protein, partial [Cyanobacteria bacterium P01_D01_bin.116]